VGAPAVGHQRQCQGWTKTGDACRAYALKDGDFCLTHSRTKEEQSAHARRMNKASKVAAREQKNAADYKPLAGYRDGVTLQQVLDVIREALNAEHELPTALSADGFTLRREPDYNTRMLAVLALIRLWPREHRASPETIREALERSLPRVHEDLATATEHGLYVEARKRWFEVSVKHNKFRGLFLDDLPSFLLAPGERKEEVMRREGKSFDNWKVRDIDSDTHVIATDDSGNEHFVERDFPRSRM